MSVWKKLFYRLTFIWSNWIVLNKINVLMPNILELTIANRLAAGHVFLHLIVTKYQRCSYKPLLRSQCFKWSASLNFNLKLSHATICTFLFSNTITWWTHIFEPPPCKNISFAKSIWELKLIENEFDVNHFKEPKTLWKLYLSAMLEILLAIYSYFLIRPFRIKMFQKKRRCFNIKKKSDIDRYNEVMWIRISTISVLWSHEQLWWPSQGSPTTSSLRIVRDSTNIFWDKFNRKSEIIR